MVGAALTVIAVLDQLEDKASNLIKQSSGEVRRLVFQAYSSIESLISNAKVAFQESLDLARSAAKDIVQTTLSQIESLVIDLEKVVKGQLRSVKEIVNSARAGIDSIRSNRPKIYSFTPRAIVGHWNQDGNAPIPIRIVGANLNQKEVKLSFGGSECQLISKTDDELVFEALKSFFPDPDPNPEDDNLVPFRSAKSTLEITRDRLLLPDKIETFPLGLYVYPSVFGTFECTIKLEKFEPQPPDSTSVFTKMYKCEGARRTNRDCRPKETIVDHEWNDGWRIITSSLKWVENGRIGSSGFDGFEDVTEKSFVTHLSAKKEGTSGTNRVTGRTQYTKQRQKSPERKEEKIIIKKGILEWGKDIRIDIPNNTIDFTLSTKLFDTSSPEITPENPNVGLVKVDYKEKIRILLQPMTVSEIEVFE